MTLTPEFSIAIASDRSSLTLSDDTTYTSPIRSAVRVYVQGFKVNSDNEATEVTFTGDDQDPETDSSWSGTYSADGHWKWYWVAIPVYAAGTFAEFDAVWSADVVYRSLAAGNVADVSDTDFWEVIADPAELALNKDEPEESANIDSYVYQRVLAANAQYAYGNQISDSGTLADENDPSILSEYNLMSLWIRNMGVADQRTEVVDGEIIARRFQALFID
jgi:hypothetical protein